MGRIVRFFTERPSSYLRDQEEYGILPAIIGSVAIIIISAIISFPISTATAIWLYEFSKENRFAGAIRQAIINISAMPSIVVGIFALAAFSVGLNMRQGLLPGGIALGILMIPIVTTNAIEALRNVPEYHKESALALGATEWEAFRRHRFPYAFPSIITGYILGLARVIGETAPILFTVAAVTNVLVPTQIIHQGVRLLPSEIFFTLKVLPIKDKEGERFGPIIASAIAMTLLVIVAILNIIAYYARKILKSKYEYNGEL
jgi:phosphate transport system permease protein